MTIFWAVATRTTRYPSVRARARFAAAAAGSFGLMSPPVVSGPSTKTAVPWSGRNRSPGRCFGRNHVL